MVNQISKTDVTDSEFLDAEELTSDGSFIYLTTGVVSTTSGTQTVVITLPSDGEGIFYGRDHPAEPGDIVIITGTSGGLGDGEFTIATVVDDLTFTIVETFGTSTGGSVDFHYVPGAKRIGLDPTGLTHVISNNVQDAIEELDASITGGGLTETAHRTLRQLIHLAAGVGGPFEGFVTGAYRVTSGGAFPTGITWYEDNTMVQKIVEKTITYNPSRQPTTVDWKVYNTDGTTLLAEATDTITYSGAFESSRIRALVDYSVGTSDLTQETHKTVRQLIHLADGVGGPFEGFPTGAYRTITYSGYYPTSIVWYEDNTMAKKLVEQTITYNVNFTQNTVEWKVYDTDGVTVLHTVTDTMAFSSFFETSRTRAIA